MITQAMVEETWREVADLSAQRAGREVVRLTEKQPDLYAFVSTWAEDLSPDALELALYLFYTVYRMFERSVPDGIRRISSEEIINKYEENESVLERLEGADERFLERAALVQSSRQPYVIASVVEAILEAPEWESPLRISDDEFGLVFLTIKTIIDTLDDLVSPKH